MVLYKYRTDSKWTEDIISKSQVWFAKPETLNDPLECSIQEIAQKSIAECCQQEKTEQLEGFVLAYVMASKEKLMWGLSKEKVGRVLSKIGTVKDINSKYLIYADFIKSRTGNFPSNPETKYRSINDILKVIGVFSLSETCENELMWGHYASGGKGIAIGFKVQDNRSITDNSFCLKVNYSNEPIVFKDRLKSVLALAVDESGTPSFLQTPAFDDPFLQEASSTKNISWEYEKEWRCIEQSSGIKHIISPITEIVFGVKCPQNIREKYILLANAHCGNSVHFFEMVILGRTLKKQRLKNV